MYKEFLSIAVDEFNRFTSAQEEFKQKVLDDWQKTFDMPRKMKKKRRKELRLDWAIANYKPFEDLGGF